MAMANDVTNTEQGQREDFEFAEPLLTAEDTQALREQSVERLRYLWSKRGFLAQATIYGLAAATLIAFAIPARFTSTARLMPPDQTSGAGVAMAAVLAGKAAGALGGELLGMKTNGDLFIGILQSRTVRDDLITKFNLRNVYWDRRWEEARKDLAKRTDISQDRKSGIITIEVTDRSPERAQQMAQEYVAALNHVVITLDTSSAHRERVFLEGRLNQVQQDLLSAEKEFSQFASKNTALDIKEQGRAMIEAGATLEGQLIAARTELEGLRQIYTNNNVRVRETQARLDELERQLKKLGGKAVSDIADAHPEDGAIYPTIRQLPVLGVTYADLYRRTRVQEAVFETLTQQFELAKVGEAKETPSVKVLDLPDLPEKKSFPPRLLIMLFGTLVSLSSGMTWLLGHEAWHATDSADVRKVFATEVWSDVRADLARISANGQNGSSPRRLLGWLRAKRRRGNANAIVAEGERIQE